MRRSCHYHSDITGSGLLFGNALFHSSSYQVGLDILVNFFSGSADTLRRCRHGGVLIQAYAIHRVKDSEAQSVNSWKKGGSPFVFV